MPFGFPKAKDLRRAFDNIIASGKRDENALDKLDAKVDGQDKRIDDLETRVEALEAIE